jgi:hypothetical protein
VDAQQQGQGQNQGVWEHQQFMPRIQL